MTVSEQCEKKLLAVKQEEKSGKVDWTLIAFIKTIFFTVIATS